MNEQEKIKARLLEIAEQTQSILALATKDARDLNDAEQRQFDSLSDEFDRLKGDLDRHQKAESQLTALSSSAGRRVDASQPSNTPRIEVSSSSQIKGKAGFATLGHFGVAVAAASRKSGSHMDQRLQILDIAPNQESVGGDGGFAVPPDFRTEIMSKVMGVDSLLAATDKLISSGNTITFPTDEIAPWQGTNPKAYWEDEAAQIPQSKLALSSETIRLNKLTCLIPVTEELLEDAPAMDIFLRRKIAEAMDYKIQDAIINGDGVGKPLGILNSPSLVTITQEAGQPADTLYFENVIKMWSRMYAPSRTRGVWLYNQDIEPALLAMSIKVTKVAGTENVGGWPVYMPPNGLSGSPYGTLMGRPMMPVEACATLGDVGDLIFADLSQYRTITKTTGLRIDTSIHLWFDYDLTAFKAVFRLGGKPWWNAPITPAKGAMTRSCFVTTETR